MRRVIIPTFENRSSNHISLLFKLRVQVTMIMDDSKDAWLEANKEYYDFIDRMNRGQDFQEVKDTIREQSFDYLDNDLEVFDHITLDWYKSFKSIKTLSYEGMGKNPWKDYSKEDPRADLYQDENTTIDYKIKISGSEDVILRAWAYYYGMPLSCEGKEQDISTWVQCLFDKYDKNVIHFHANNCSFDQSKSALSDSDLVYKKLIQSELDFDLTDQQYDRMIDMIKSSKGIDVGRIYQKLQSEQLGMSDEDNILDLF